MGVPLDVDNLPFSTSPSAPAHALWSWRPTHWRAVDPGVENNNGLTKPYDLVADGGPNSVWIIEVGDADPWAASTPS
jgi:hypothetical protein